MLASLKPFLEFFDEMLPLVMAEVAIYPA